MAKAIKIPGTVTPTVFNLPCIFSVHKENDTICYLLYDWDTNGQYIKAYPGQWIVEDCGHWLVLTDTEYETYRQYEDGQR